MFYYSDLIYILPALLLTLWASARVKSTYNKYSQVLCSRGLTGAAAARRILDENGDPIDGYDSGNHFGDSLDRPVPFEKALSDLNGKQVKLEFTLKDADLYSFQFA